MSNDATLGALNLLHHCAGVTTGDKILILYEDPALGWYQAGLADFVATVARDLGAHVDIQMTAGPDNRFIDGSADDCIRNIQDSLNSDRYDICLFFARLGDQLRFEQATTLSSRTFQATICFQIHFLNTQFC